MDRWSDVVNSVQHAHLAHAPEWFEAIQNAYGHTPLYIQAEDGEGRLGVLPAFLVRSRVFGTVVASMPFLDGGGPCAPTEGLANAAAAALVEEARRRGAGSVELRSAVRLDLPAPAREDKVNLVLPLPADPAVLWKRLDARVRNQVRKAERSGLSIEFGHVEALDAFYDVFAVNMRDLGSPVHGRVFFAALLEAFGKRARVGLVRKGPSVIGGLIALAFKDTLLVPWASSLRQYLSLCPNILMYWEILAAGCREGFARFDFGRS
ncbi:MAG TPA: GNAT family N-acetyltransferase, partial [Candidatus Sulfotelmatobacter sp.]|nr:GNAT family N-acetyltransferase [Candidatus Sulfotelmatobacter sp.]